MITKSIAWAIAFGIAILLYYFFMTLILKVIRAKKAAKDRWEKYGVTLMDQIDKGRLAALRKKSLGLDDNLNEMAFHRIFSLEKFEGLIYRCGLRTHAKQHIMGQFIGTVVFTEMMYFFMQLPVFLSLLLGFMMASLLHILYLKRKERKWQKAFIKAFPPCLDIINRGLKSGLTLGRGIAMVAEEADEPIRGEFYYIASQFQLGVSPDAALTQAANRIGCDEFRFFTIALIIQREMGGSISDILGKLSELIRERERFRNKVWTLSSESRTTALIVGLLPVLLGVLLELVSPGYTKFFFYDPRGQMMLWICLGLSITGVTVITRMMKMET